MYSGGRFSEAAKLGNGYYNEFRTNLSKEYKNLNKEEYGNLTKDAISAYWKEYKKKHIDVIRSARQRLLKSYKDEGKTKKLSKDTKQKIQEQLYYNNDDYKNRYDTYGKNEGVNRDLNLKNIDKEDGISSRNMREQMKTLRNTTLNSNGYGYGVSFTNLYNNALMNVRNKKQLLLNKEYGTTPRNKPYRTATISNEEKSIIISIINSMVMNGEEDEIQNNFENMHDNNFDANFRLQPPNVDIYNIVKNDLKISRKQRRNDRIPNDKTLEIIEDRMEEMEGEQQLPEQIIEPTQYIAPTRARRRTKAEMAAEKEQKRLKQAELFARNRQLIHEMNEADGRTTEGRANKNTKGY
jgi:hypothetical protein